MIILRFARMNSGFPIFRAYVAVPNLFGAFVERAVLEIHPLGVLDAEELAHAEHPVRRLDRRVK